MCRNCAFRSSIWHCSGSENSFELSTLLAPLGDLKSECLFLNGLTMGATDSGSHPGGAKKLLTAVDGGNGTSLDQALAQTAGKDAPFRHLYLGAMAAQNSPSGDKFISYPSPGQTQAPEDDPRAAFTALFGAPGMGGGGMVDPAKQRVLAAAMADVESLRASLGEVERAKLDLHLESLHELEGRLQGPMGGVGGSCDAPAIDSSGFGDGQLYDGFALSGGLGDELTLLALLVGCVFVGGGVGEPSNRQGTALFNQGIDLLNHGVASKTVSGVKLELACRCGQ